MTERLGDLVLRDEGHAEVVVRRRVVGHHVDFRLASIESDDRQLRPWEPLGRKVEGTRTVQLVEDFARYLYLPRLVDTKVLLDAIGDQDLHVLRSGLLLRQVDSRLPIFFVQIDLGQGFRI